MPTTKVSTKHQVLIPRQVREKLHARAGQRYVVMSEDGQIAFVPAERIDIRSLRGFLKGKMTNDNIRDEEDRF